MINSIKLSPIYKETNNFKSKPIQLVHPVPRKNIILNKSRQGPIIKAPSNSNCSPEIIHPIFASKGLGEMDQKGFSPSGSIKTSFSQSNFIPLDSLSPTKPTPKKVSKRHRNSCSVDISWSPNLMVNENEIRRKKINESDGEKEKQSSQLSFNQIDSVIPKNQVSPLWNYVET